MHGRGKMEWPDKSVYNGRFEDGMLCGEGTLEYENGDRYEGEWENDVRHGQGIYYNAKMDAERTSEWIDDVEQDPPSDANAGASLYQLHRKSNLPKTMDLNRKGLAGRAKGYTSN